MTTTTLDVHTIDHYQSVRLDFNEHGETFGAERCFNKTRAGLEEAYAFVKGADEYDIMFNQVCSDGSIKTSSI